MTNSTVTEPPNLAPYRRPLAPMSGMARSAHARGVVASEFPPAELAGQVLIAQRDAHGDGVYRSTDGRALILCTTPMPGVTPAMIDWWFGWHLPDSERYRLWHPTAHVRARVREDRSHLRDDRARYIDNVSYVDEYIGRALKRLAIAFEPPAGFGLSGLDTMAATAICARTTDRVLASEGGCLVHLVVPTAEGAEMRSAFWLGSVQNRLPVLGALVNVIANTGPVRRLAVGDRFVLDLFQHCAEEMQHLAGFLPELHAEIHRAPAG